MKKVVLSLILLSAVLLSAVSPGLPSSDIGFIKQFRLPAWKYVGFDLNVNGSGQNLGYEGWGDYQRRQYYTVQVNPSVNQYIESESKIRSIKFSIVDKYDYVERYYSHADYSEKEVERENHLQIDASFNQKSYTGSNYINADVQYSYNYDHYYENKHEEDNFKRYCLGAQAGFGAGKVRNVTPVIRALRFKKRFNSIGKETMGRQEVEALAKVMAKYPGYNYVYDRSGKNFWDAAFNTLGDKMNALSGYETFMVTEAMTEEVGTRLQGSEINANLYYGTAKYKSDWMWMGPVSYIGAQINSRAYNNISTGYQVGAEANIGYYIPTSDNEPFDNMFLCRLNTNHLLTITDRLLLTNSLTFVGQSVKYSGYGENKGFRLINDNTLSFYLENNLSIDLYVNGTFQRFDNGDDFFGNYLIYPDFYTESFVDQSRELASWDFGINLNYRFRTM